MTPAQILILVQAINPADAGNGQLYFATQAEYDAYLRLRKVQ